MHTPEILEVLAGVMLLYGIVAKRLDSMWISAPVIFVVCGVLLGIGTSGADHPTVSTEWVKIATELTLAVLLFADASTIRIRDAEKGIGIPARLLGLGLPLTAAAGTAVALLILPGLGWAQCALLACILAPTDAALGLAVVTNPVVPSRIRRSLNIESGLNDGLTAPFVTLFLAITIAEQAHGAHTHVLTSALAVFGGGGLGIAIGGSVGWLSRFTSARGWMSGTSAQLVVLATPLFCYAVALAVGANGFVAAYICGFAFGEASRRQFLEAEGFTESVGLYASFIVWAIFGELFVYPELRLGFAARPILYAVLSLTVIRMVPVAISMLGARLKPVTVAFMGWFGPRGLASVVFTLLAIESLPGHAALPELGQVATWTILLSVVLHGFTATPLAARYGRRIAGMGDGLVEMEDTGATIQFRRRSLTR
jgi:NhaP-type Na+/H+ or K+/H+ antiporter